MNFTLKPHPLIAHWIPGFIVLAVILVLHYGWSPHLLTNSLSAYGHAAEFALIVAAFVVGEFIDALRDIFEWILEYACPNLEMDWTAFFSKDKGQLENLENYYFTYYVFCANMFVGVVFTFAAILISRICPLESVQAKALSTMAVGGIVFFIDAAFLRKEIRNCITKEKGAGHGKKE